MNELELLLERLVLMEKASTVETYGKEIDAVPVSFYVQEPPFWKNTLTGFLITLNSEALQYCLYQITATLVVSKVSSGFEQQAEQAMHEVLPVVNLYFGKRRQLRRTRDDSRLVGLDPRGAIITGGQVDYNAAISESGGTVFAVDFRFEVPMMESVEQVFF